MVFENYSFYILSFLVEYDLVLTVKVANVGDAF